MANSSVSIYIKVWQNTKRMADSRDQYSRKVIASNTADFHCLVCQEKWMTKPWKEMPWIVESKLNNGKCDFRLSSSTMDQTFTLKHIFEKSWWS